MRQAKFMPLTGGLNWFCYGSSEFIKKDQDLPNTNGDLAGFIQYIQCKSVQPIVFEKI